VRKKTWEKSDNRIRGKAGKRTDYRPCAKEEDQESKKKESLHKRSSLSSLCRKASWKSLPPKEKRSKRHFGNTEVMPITGSHFLKAYLRYMYTRVTCANILCEFTCSHQLA